MRYYLFKMYSSVLANHKNLLINAEDYNSACAIMRAWVENNPTYSNVTKGSAELHNVVNLLK